MQIVIPKDLDVLLHVILEESAGEDEVALYGSPEGTKNALWAFLDGSEKKIRIYLKACALTCGEPTAASRFNSLRIPMLMSPYSINMILPSFPDLFSFSVVDYVDASEEYILLFM